MSEVSTAPLNVIVIGGGPAGMMSAIAAAQAGAHVILLEKNEKLGKKLYITGKGRCNVTNACDLEAFFTHVVRNSRFMRGAFSRFNNRDLINFLNECGVPTVVERGERVFPQSGKASDVTRALEKCLRSAGAEVRLNTRVTGLLTNDGQITGVDTVGGTIPCDVCVVATGGRSYPVTGSDGDGFRFAETLGINVTPLSPSLTGIRVKDQWPGTLAGLTLKNIELSASIGKKSLFCERGELLFTHDGISGPLVLSLSAFITGMQLDNIVISLDLKPALSYSILDERILRDMAAAPRRNAYRTLDALVPKSMADTLMRLSGVDEGKRIADISSKERAILCRLLKDLPLTPMSLGGWDEAVVTRGGVDIKAVSPVTMASKDIAGLYFAGEALDVDALTGGFNLQIAFSTGYVAGINAATGGK